MLYGANSACVDIDVLVMGPIENNVFLIGDGEATFVVDPTCDADRILKALGDRSLDAIVITHAHWDHLGAAADLRDKTGAAVIASAIDAPVIVGQKILGANHRPFRHCMVDQKVGDGDVVEIGAMRWEVMMTPGHTPGSMCLFLDSRSAPREGVPVLISGDTLFAGTHGRTDFEGGSPAAMRESLERLATLPEETLVLPGHNAPTTIARELPWLTRANIAR